MIARLLVALIRVYQLLVSPLLGNVCRFEPSCSRYAVACLQTHGALRGTLLSVVRVCKCHPLHPGGWDPPPPARSRGITAERHSHAPPPAPSSAPPSTTGAAGSPPEGRAEAPGPRA